MRDTSISSLLPDSIQELGPLRVFYKYDLPTGRKIFNYNKFLKELDRDAMKSILEGDCGCRDSPFLYEPHGHVITGDLSFITHEELRQVMTYGTKYREAVNVRGLP